MIRGAFGAHYDSRYALRHPLSQSQYQYDLSRDLDEPADTIFKTEIRLRLAGPTSWLPSIPSSFNKASWRGSDTVDGSPRLSSSIFIRHQGSHQSEVFEMAQQSMYSLLSCGTSLLSKCYNILPLHPLLHRNCHLMHCCSQYDPAATKVDPPQPFSKQYSSSDK